MATATKKEVKINLGCGKDYKKGWINIDNLSMAECKCDVYSDIQIYDTKPKSVDKILLSHVAMYLRPEEFDELLPRWYKWLKPGGTLEIETIDLNEVKQWNSIEKLLIPLFGTEMTGPHRWAWSQNPLIGHLKRAGFKDNKIKSSRGSKNPTRDFKLIATR